MEIKIDIKKEDIQNIYKEVAEKAINAGAKEIGIINFIKLKRFMRGVSHYLPKLTYTTFNILYNGSIFIPTTLEDQISDEKNYDTEDGDIYIREKTNKLVSDLIKEPLQIKKAKQLGKLHEKAIETYKSLIYYPKCITGLDKKIYVETKNEFMDYIESFALFLPSQNLLSELDWNMPFEEINQKISKYEISLIDTSLFPIWMPHHPELKKSRAFTNPKKFQLASYQTTDSTCNAYLISGEEGDRYDTFLENIHRERAFLKESSRYILVSENIEKIIPKWFERREKLIDLYVHE